MLAHAVRDTAPISFSLTDPRNSDKAKFVAQRIRLWRAVAFFAKALAVCDSCDVDHGAKVVLGSRTAIRHNKRDRVRPVVLVSHFRVLDAYRAS